MTWVFGDFNHPDLAGYDPTAFRRRSILQAHDG
jgi:hypothetical protein